MMGLYEKNMTDIEYIALESLLQKLRGELGHRYVINPNHMGELIHIGLYKANGDLIDQVGGVSVKDCVMNLTNANESISD